MPPVPEAIVISQRHLVRELLGELLRSRCGVRHVTLCNTPEEAAARLGSAQLLVCDMYGLSDRVVDAFEERATVKSRRLTLIRIDDSFGGCDAIVEVVRSQCSPARPAHERLTPNETDVLLAVAAGLRNSDIARRMRRSPKTVEKHRANVQRKLGLRNVAQLTAYVIRSGLLNADAILATRRA
jgi:DNA-binding NarL/FixJ family response regulator